VVNIRINQIEYEAKIINSFNGISNQNNIKEKEKTLHVPQ